MIQKVEEIEANIIMEAEYEDVDSEYTDVEESCINESSCLPGFLSGSWTQRIWSRMKHWYSFSGNFAWIITTSMLLVGLPILFAYDREKALSEQQLMGITSSQQ